MTLRKYLVFFLLFLPLFSGCATNGSLILADDYQAQGRWDEAHQIYQEQLKKDPTNLKLRKEAEILRKKTADHHFEQGNNFLSQNKVLSALDEMKHAIALDPGRAVFRIALAEILKKREAEESVSLGRKLAEAQKFNEARERFEHALKFDPESEAAREEILLLEEAIRKNEESIPGLSLKSNIPITLKFENAKLSDVFSILSESSGINILFDKDVRPENSTLSIFIKDTSFKEALNLILATNNLFMKRISDETILIIQKNKQKIDQYEDLIIRTFYLFHVDPKQMKTLLETMLKPQSILLNEQINALIVRDTPEKIRLAEKMIEANDRQKAEVMFEVEILEVNRTKSLKFGWNFAPSSANVRAGAASELTARELEKITKDLVFFTIPSILIDFFKQDSNARTLANPRIRVIDGETAKINIGDRVPILLSSTTASAATGTNPGGTSTTTSTEFKDTGVKLNIVPKIHLGGNITIKLGLEVTSLGDQVDLGSGVKQFRFGTRTADTVLNVRDGETIIIGGLIRDENRKSENKVPGLGDIPFLGKLFTGMEKSEITTDVVMTLTPRIVHQLDVPAPSLQSFWSGTKNNYSMRPLFSETSSATTSRKKQVLEIPKPLKPKASLVIPQVNQTPQLLIHPRHVTLAPQNDLPMTFQINSGQQDGSGHYKITFNPSLLRFKNASPQDKGQSANFLATSHPGSGLIEVRWKGIESGDSSKPDVSFEVVFQGLRRGESFIEFKQALSATDSIKSPPAKIIIR